MAAAPFIKRFFGKKRGERNTRSDVLGGASLGLFFGVMFVGGAIGLSSALLTRTVPDFRANYGFRATECRVVDKRELEQPSTEQANVTVYEPQLLIEYTVDGEAYRVWTYKLPPLITSSRAQSEAVLSRFDVGRTYRCWFDPHTPNVAVLQRGHDLASWLILVLPVSFLAIGGGGLAYAWLNWGKSAEHRSALARRTSRPFDDRASTDRFPHVPRNHNLVNSPGTRLAFRLPSAAPSWTLLGLAIAALVWNTVVAILAAVAVSYHRAGAPDWMLTSLVGTFALVGLGLIVLFVRRFWASSGVGPTIIEIDRHPLSPGQSCQVFLHQAGRLNVRSLVVHLVCEEHATYQQGTNTRTEAARVYEEQLVQRERVTIRRGAPLEMQWTLTIPASAMHSFVAEHNSVHWKLCVTAVLDGWPRLERSYALHVFPVPMAAVIE